ncbi:TPA: hypothetical protein ACQZIS_002080 [Citrobacter braakii]
MTALNKQAQAIISDIRLKRVAGDVYAPIIRWDEFEVITGALEAAEKRIADQRGIILSARNFISEYAQNGDAGAAEFVKILDRAAGIGVKGE